MPVGPNRKRAQNCQIIGQLHRLKWTRRQRTARRQARNKKRRTPKVQECEGSSEFGRHFPRDWGLARRSHLRRNAASLDALVLPPFIPAGRPQRSHSIPEPSLFSAGPVSRARCPHLGLTGEATLGQWHPEVAAVLSALWTRPDLCPVLGRGIFPYLFFCALYLLPSGRNVLRPYTL